VIIGENKQGLNKRIQTHMILTALLFDVIDGHSLKHNIAAPMLMRTFCSSMFQTLMFDVLTHHIKNVKFRHMKYSFSKGSQEICHYFLLIEEKKRNQIQPRKKNLQLQL
jgi:hypothetical protein